LRASRIQPGWEGGRGEVRGGGEEKEGRLKRGLRERGEERGR